MTERIDYGEEGGVLNLVREGMSVYDNEENKLGEVDTVFFGTMQAETADAATASGRDLEDDVWLDLEDLLDPDEAMPEELVERLRRDGFVHIEGGLFGNDRYIMPQQIAAVTDDGVYLKVAGDEVLEEGDY